MGRIRVTQVKSTIKRPKTQVDTIQSLGLGRIGKVKEHEATPQILGMVRKVSHLIAVEEI
jgi:large subunit ribosomal protein L30